MISDRQNRILKLIVEEYIKFAKPVGSKNIAKVLKCSSATIRSEMNYLEEVGLLEKTHISSGRVPSEKGYRYYVDNLMRLNKMNNKDLNRLQVIFSNNELKLNDCIEKSLELISEITHCATISLGRSSHDNTLKEINVVPVNDTTVVAIIVTNKGYVEHKNMELYNVPLDDIKKTVNLINNLIVGTAIDEINEKLEFEVKPIIAKYVTQHEQVYKAFYEVFTDFTNQNVQVVGKNNFLMQPEFNSVDKVRDIFNKFEDKEIISKIEEDNKDINIYIGEENNFDGDCTVIKTGYKTDKEEGTIAIVGPKRMDYNRVIGILNYIKQNIGSDDNG